MAIRNGPFLRDRQPFFTTDATGLFDAFLSGFPAGAVRQHYNCHACRRFMETYGSLVWITDSGKAASIFWDRAVPEMYEAPVAAVRQIMKRAHVNGVFLSPAAVWGSPVTGLWHHMAAGPAACQIHRDATLSASQAMAAKLEDYKTVCRACAEFPVGLIETAVRVIGSDSLYRSEKVYGAADWLLKMASMRSLQKNRMVRSNLTWLWIVHAPAGFCHPRAGMIGSLLEDLASGQPFDVVRRRFAEKMNPTRYQRPQASPKAGTIDAAEKVIGKLKAAGSLDRRFALMSDIRALWRVRTSGVKTAEPEAGVFANLRRSTPGRFGSSDFLWIPPQTMTWVKFRERVLPGAERVELLVPSGLLPFAVLLTAVDPEAPPILQWDYDDARNPVSWYLYVNGSRAEEFGIDSGGYHTVKAIALKPSAWNEDRPCPNHGDGVLFVLANAKDTRNMGSKIFPETLKVEFHQIRSVIEAHSRVARVQGIGVAQVAGLMFFGGGGRQDWNCLLRVTNSGSTGLFKLDRWD